MKSAAIPSAPDPVLTGSLVPNILVVDDDSAVRNLLVGLYESSGYTVIAVRSGEEAISILEEGTIDFVITDIRFARNQWDRIDSQHAGELSRCPGDRDYGFNKHRYCNQRTETWRRRLCDQTLRSRRGA